MKGTLKYELGKLKDELDNLGRLLLKEPLGRFLLWLIMKPQKYLGGK